MSEPHVSVEDQYEPERYEIRLKGHLHARWAERFAGMSLTHASDGTTILVGLVVDQAALFGVLRNVRDLGLPLIAVMAVAPGEAKGSEGDTEPDHTNTETTL
jgi:hypothetical protein